MAIKKKNFKPGEIAIFDDAIIFKRGAYWQFRMWLRGEGKYAIKSLHTRSESTAIEKGKTFYMELYTNLRNGKKYFSITTKEGVAKYLEYRKKDVESRAIVPERLVTIRTHLENWLEFIGRDTKLKELGRDDCENYFEHRSKASIRKAGQVTVVNEQSTINACMKYLFRDNETTIDGFNFRKLPKIDKNSDDVRRATLTNEEYVRVTHAMRSYTKKAKDVDEEEMLYRQIVRHWVIVATNSGLRVGEQRQLRWSDIEIVRQQVKGVPTVLAKIGVRAETSKVRKSRKLMCRGGEYFERLKRITQPASASGFVFSADGNAELSEKTLLQHFYKILEAANVPSFRERGIVPYSLRHFMVTQRAKSGLTYHQIAAMIGSSIAEVENTYHHLDDSALLTAAVADFRRTEDGTIVVV